MSGEETNTSEAPQPGTKEYDEMMAQRGREARANRDSPLNSMDPDQQADQGNTEEESQEEEPSTDSTPQVPEGVPEKFIREDGTVDVEALAKSYQEAERRLSGSSSDGQDSEGSGDDSQDSAGQDAADQAGLDYGSLKQKIETNGDIDEEDYKTFEKSGVPRELVQEHIALRKAEAERTRESVQEYVGGEEKLNEMLQWAGKNLSDAEIQSYNQMLNDGRWQVAVDVISHKMSAQSKTAGEPKISSSESSPGGSVVGYQSRDEMRADMADPKYRQSGPEGDKFRAEVAQKMKHAAWRKK